MVGLFGWDFHGTIWEPSRLVIHGTSPYPPADVHLLVAMQTPAVYPPTIFFAAIPLGLLPATAAAALWDVLTAGSLALAFWLVGVRDLRIYAVVFVSFPFVASMVLGQIDGLLALGAALTWRYRDRVLRAGLAVAAVVAVKLFLWPLGVWLFVTGRRRAAAVSALALPVLVFGAWAGIGFGGLREYPNLLAKLTDGFAWGGYSPVATANRAGLPMGVASIAAPLTALVLLAFAARAVRAGDERVAFAAAVTAGVFSSPIVWMHSMLILFVALAAARPRFSAVWMLPLALWISEHEPPPVLRLVAAQCVILALVVLALRPWRGVPARLAAAWR